MAHRILPAVAFGTVWVLLGCGHPSASTEDAGLPKGRLDDQDWTLAQKTAFHDALQRARRDLYRRLLDVRVSQDKTIGSLIKQKTAGKTDVHALAAEAPLRSVEWGSDRRRCRVRISLGLPRVMEAVARWDRENKLTPHDQILRLNAQQLLDATAEGSAD